MASTNTKATGGAAALVLLLAVIVAIGTRGAPPPRSTTTTTSTAPATTTSLVPPGTDATAALQRVLNETKRLTVDREYLVEGTITPPSGSIITFTDKGLFRRTVAPAIRTLPVLKLTEGNITLIRPRITGPNPCYWTWKWNPPGEYPYAQYDAAKEAQHAITIEGGSNYRIDSPEIRDVWGDAVNIDRQPSDIEITNLFVRCVGRSVISNTGSTNVTVRGGDVAGAFWWVFNVEPYNTRFVKDYLVEGVKVGFSRDRWLFAGGPSFSCLVENVVLRNLTILPPDRGVSVAACVAGKITY